MAHVIQRASNTIYNFASRASNILVSKNVAKVQTAGLISKARRDPNFKHPVEFPYETKKYRLIDSFFDGTTWRLNENSKIIVVDGSMTCEKEEFGKAIADELDLLFIPHANLDFYYVNDYGYDLRQLNDKLPKKLKSFDPHEFIANPHDERSALLQLKFFKIRFWQYHKAMSHIFNTGQGVVLTRSLYSDFVFLDTFIKFGFLPNTMRGYYNLMWSQVERFLMRPHVVIYLDNPVDNIINNLKRRNVASEINSPVYQPKVLRELENSYKKRYLKNISEHAEVLLYDRSSPIDMEVVIDNLEELELDMHDKNYYNFKMVDWNFPTLNHWDVRRMELAEKYHIKCQLEGVAYFDCPELWIDGGDIQQYNEVTTAAPGGKYAYGYNKDMGDSYLFKSAREMSPFKRFA